MKLTGETERRGVGGSEKKSMAVRNKGDYILIHTTYRYLK